MEDKQWNCEVTTEKQHSETTTKMQFLEFPQHIEDDINDDPVEGNVKQFPGTPEHLDENIDHVPVRGTRTLSDIYERCNVAVFEPANFTEAEKDDKWIQAKKEELKMIEKKDTWQLVDKPQDRKIIGVKWAYRTKLNADGSNENLVAEFKTEMLKVFEMTDLGLMSYFLGMEVKQDHNGILISQKKYAKEILKKFHMEGCKISLLSRFLHSASEIHFQAAKRIVRYIKGTTNFGIKYSNCQNFKLLGYSDSDWAGSIDDMKSTTGFCFSFGSSFFSWCSKKQEMTAQSTAEAEYVAANATVNQAIWIRKILADLHMEKNEPTQVYVDNQAAIAISKDPVFHGKTKHFKIKLYHLREEQKHGEVKLLYCKTEDQIADVFTKALSKARFEILRDKLRLCSY
nr:Retrovirus-related Pol polyprotein from transposon TNT 1-94 [Ipomoea batatas]